MSGAIERFGAWLRGEGIEWHEITDAATGEVGVSVRYEDASLARAELIGERAARLGLYFAIGDKGVSFFSIAKVAIDKLHASLREE